MVGRLQIPKGDPHRAAAWELVQALGDWKDGDIDDGELMNAIQKLIYESILYAERERAKNIA